MKEAYKTDWLDSLIVRAPCELKFDFVWSWVIEDFSDSNSFTRNMIITTMLFAIKTRPPLRAQTYTCVYPRPVSIPLET